MKLLRIAAAALLGTSLLSAHAFTDVAATAWYAPFITELSADGIIGGNPDGSFGPDNSITRAELAKIAVNIAKKSGVITSDDTSGAPAFKDVLKGAWYEEFVQLAAKNKVFEGYKNPDGSLTGEFKPENKVTRAEAIKVLLSAANVPAKQDPAEKFTDVPANTWFTAYVTTAFNWNIVDGYRNAAGALTGKFGPADLITRAQAAKIGVLVMDPYGIKAR